jgi:hypothetical protein
MVMEIAHLWGLQIHTVQLQVKLRKQLTSPMKFQERVP